VAEIGIDMARFETAPRLAAWAGVAPGNDESAGKQRSGKTRKGNRSLRAVLTQLAHAAVRTKGTNLSYHLKNPWLKAHAVAGCQQGGTRA